MTQVFVRVRCLNDIRLGFAVSSITRWRMQKDAQLYLIIAEDSLVVPTWMNWTKHLLLSKNRFWTASKQVAENQAKEGSIYVLADDDQLIIGPDFIKRGSETLANNPEYGMLSAWAITCEVPLDIYDSTGCSDIVDIPSCIGCPYFVRKGTLGTIPDSEVGQQDQAMCQAIKDKGLKLGMLRNVKYNHLGAHYSSAIGGHWNG